MENVRGVTFGRRLREKNSHHMNVQVTQSKQTITRRDGNSCTDAVSYTHLDVYKRQHAQY